MSKEFLCTYVMCVMLHIAPVHNNLSLKYKVATMSLMQASMAPVPNPHNLMQRAVVTALIPPSPILNRANSQISTVCSFPQAG